MKREYVVEHKGNFYQLYSFKGIYLHPRIVKTIIPKYLKRDRISNYNPILVMCTNIGLKLGLSKKEISHLVTQCMKNDDIV